VSVPDKIKSMIRVDQAGEYGAVRIYAGQMAVMGTRAPHSEKLVAMAAQEAAHARDFNALQRARGVRPTLLQPVWHIAGFVLGAATALVSPEAAMACTAAIETEIDRHYSQQLDEIGSDDPELSSLITNAREDEREHLGTALASGAEKAPAYPLLSSAIRLGCRVAIGISSRI
jgi:ubiquinone biosynthesis monooxygenase Coq7